MQAGPPATTAVWHVGRGKALRAGKDSPVVRIFNYTCEAGSDTAVKVSDFKDKKVNIVADTSINDSLNQKWYNFLKDKGYTNDEAKVCVFPARHASRQAVLLALRAGSLAFRFWIIGGGVRGSVISLAGVGCRRWGVGICVDFSFSIMYNIIRINHKSYDCKKAKKVDKKWVFNR